MNGSSSTLTGSSLGDSHDALTNSSNDFSVAKIKVKLIEMEDVLFHLDSAVMMPDVPQGASSADGSGDNPDDAGTQAKQNKVSGIKAIALVFRETEFFPEYRLIVAGHADTSGQVAPNFDLSELRAQNVLHLLTGEENGKKWAETCVKKQRIEDHQQIMQHYASVKGWACDPGDLDNTWGPNTEAASQLFFENTAGDGAGDILEKIKKDGQKRWPLEAWLCVYQLYVEELRGILAVDETALAQLRASLKFADENRRFVGCGESFPIDSKEKDNYRSQQNRRVEVLLVEEADAFALICPPTKSRTHTVEECPLWDGTYIEKSYIDADDLTATMYHLQFLYYDRVKSSVEKVPAGLQIRAFQSAGTATTEAACRMSWRDGVYRVRVQDDPARTALFFEFQTAAGSWVRTAAGGGAAQVTTRPVAEVEGLEWPERVEYYDLPVRWSSFNYWVRTSAGAPAGDRYQATMTSRGIKPYGNAKTSDSQPLIFSLDDVVLTDANGRQDIRDQDAGGSGQPLSADSRVTLLYLDSADEYRMKIHSPRTDQGHFSDTVFDHNLITDAPANSRVVVFCSAFYSIWSRRTEAVAGFNAASGHLLGARAAMINDQSVHRFVECHVNYTTMVPPNDYTQDTCGNYELHYLHRCGLLNSKPLSCLVVYWNCRFRLHTDTPATDPSLDPNWFDHFMRDGMVTSMDRTNRPYLLERKQGSIDVLIRPFHYYEGKIDARGGQHKCMVEISKVPEAWMKPQIAKFEQDSYRIRPGMYADGGDGAADVDGTTYGPLTSAHEMGHATGNFDDYLYSIRTGGETFAGIPSFDQPFTAPGGPYSKDLVSRMFHNRSPRMRNYWHFVNWVNDASGADLRPFLDGTTFRLSYPYGGTGSPLVVDFTDARFRNTCRPSFRRNGFTLGTTGRCDLLLYKTGGETGRMLDNRHIFDGILVICTRITVDFDRTFWDWVRGRQWALADRRNWIQQSILIPLDARLNNFYVECQGSGLFTRLYLTANPFFWVTTGGNPPEAAHFDLEVTRNGRDNFSTSGSGISCGDQVSSDRLLQHMFGKTSVMPFVAADLAGVATWVGNVAGGTATVKQRGT